MDKIRRVMVFKNAIPTIILLIHIFALTNTARAGHLDTLEIFSSSMQKVSRCLVITPDDYTYSKKPYPVLYLLHGWSGNYAGWLTDAPQLRAHADTYQMIIVCPDGGYDSWYIDSPVDSTVRYDTHIASEVVDAIDHYYHTIRGPQGRAIAGLSMGGHGAVLLAIRHPEVFGAAGSMAGGLDLRPFRKNDWDLKGVLGDPVTQWKNWEDNSVVNVLSMLKGRKMPLAIDCGVGDFFLEANRAAHTRLIELEYPHDYTERPGEHNHAYWGHAVDFQILFFNEFFHG
jgi:S-formylglutathione hydrolase FrmB